MKRNNASLVAIHSVTGRQVEIPLAAHMGYLLPHGESARVMRAVRNGMRSEGYKTSIAL